MDCSEEPDLKSNNEKRIEKESTEDTMELSEELVDEKPIITKENECAESEERIAVKKSILEHLSTNDRVFFKSLQKDEELSKQQKQDIAEELLDRNYGLFLAKFGNHLLKEHICYFENRSKEDSLIVDIHLKQLNKVLEQKSKKESAKTITDKTAIPDQEMEVAIEVSPTEKAMLNLRKQLLDHISLSKDAHFKSQQFGEPDLNQQEKRDIAEALLDRSDSLFLARFGTYLLEEHLAYFDQKSCKENYEVEYYLNLLKKTHCKGVSEVDIKNRRFEALKKMVDEGSYFCETEMRNRNPLLYEQLVGRFLTADERRERLNNIDTTNITFVNLLLEQMDREAVKKLKKEQEEAEEDAIEEEENSDAEMEDEEEYDSEDDNDLDKSLWGEGYTDGSAPVSIKTNKKKEEKKTQENTNKGVPELSDSEKRLLMDEFRSSMFSNFLQGKDLNFDYSQVDYNPEYDDLEARGQDEEEKYFDEESSHSASCERMSDGEDLLDQYMEKLEPEPTPQQLADKIQELGHPDT